MIRFLALIFTSSLCFSQTAKTNAKTFIANKNFVSAQNEMLLFLESDPNDMEAIELLGDAYSLQKRWDFAITQYKTLITRDAQNANYHYKYGGVLGMKALSVSKFKALGIIGNLKQAFIKAAELDPKHIEARWALVELYVSLPGIIGGSSSKALAYAEELDLLSKLDGALAKGYVYEYDDAPEIAERFYRLAMKHADNVNCSSKNDNNRNALYYQIGKVSSDYNIQSTKGIKCLNTYLAQHSAKDGVPKAWAYYRLAKLYKHQKNKAVALKWISKAILDLPEIKIFKTERAAISQL